MSSTFNADQFLGTETSDIGATSYVQVPEGEHRGQITKIDARQFSSKKTGDNYTVLDITWAFRDPKLIEETGLSEPTARQTVFIDLTESGGLDFGKNKNVALSRLRDALGQQRAGKPWSVSHMMGHEAICLVRHDTDDNGDPRAQVTRVASLTAKREETATPARGRSARAA